MLKNCPRFRSGFPYNWSCAIQVYGYRLKARARQRRFKVLYWVCFSLLGMDTGSAKPRVNGSMLAKHTGQYVCLVGKNMGVAHGGASMTLECSDGKSVTLKFPRPLQDPLDPYVEVLGCVDQDLTITVERIVNYGTDFDLEAYNEVIQLAANFPQLFSPTHGQVKNEMDMQF